MSKTVKPKKSQERHYFFLNPYEDCAFTKCPKCNGKTKVRKIPLVIHIEPQQLLFLNKQCKYCPYCDLIIAKQSELEVLMVFSLQSVNPKMIGNDYFVMGTLDRKDWQQGDRGLLSSKQILERIYVFKDIWDFEFS